MLFCTNQAFVIIQPRNFDFLKQLLVIELVLVRQWDVTIFQINYASYLFWGGTFCKNCRITNIMVWDLIE